MYTPQTADIVPRMVSSRGSWAANPEVYVTAPSSTVWFTANYAIYQPILVPVICVVRRIWWANGATVSASYNVDCGVYADAGFKPGVKLISTGSTAQGTASEVQFVDVTDTTLAPGRYWLALSCSSASATFFGLAWSTSYNALFSFTEASLPLPATATPVESVAYGYVFGFATTASP